MLRLSSVICLLALFFASWTCAKAQKMDTVLVDVSRYSIDELPLAGHPFNSTNFSFKVREGASKGAILAFKPAKVGKLDGVKLLIAVKQGEILGSGIQVEGAKKVKQVRKMLQKQFGSPFSLIVVKETETLEWKPTDNQPYMIRMTTPEDDSYCKFWVSLR